MLALRSTKSLEILIEFELIARSSKVIDLGVSRKPICDILLVIIVTLAVIPTGFEITMFKIRNWLVYPRLPCNV